MRGNTQGRRLQAVARQLVGALRQPLRQHLQPAQLRRADQRQESGAYGEEERRQGDRLPVPLVEALTGRGPLLELFRRQQADALGADAEVGRRDNRRLVGDVAAEVRPAEHAVERQEAHHLRDWRGSTRRPLPTNAATARREQRPLPPTAGRPPRQRERRRAARRRAGPGAGSGKARPGGLLVRERVLAPGPSSLSYCSWTVMPRILSPGGRFGPCRGVARRQLLHDVRYRRSPCRRRCISRSERPCCASVRS